MKPNFVGTYVSLDIVSWFIGKKSSALTKGKWEAIIIFIVSFRLLESQQLIASQRARKARINLRQILLLLIITILEIRTTLF